MMHPSSGNVQYVSSVVAEAVRISKAVPSKCGVGAGAGFEPRAASTPGLLRSVRSDRPRQRQRQRQRPPVLAYTWHRYHSSPSVGFVCDGDEAM